MICMILFVRGPLPLLKYSKGTRLQVNYPIWYNYNIMSCPARLHLAVNVLDLMDQMHRLVTCINLVSCVSVTIWFLITRTVYRQSTIMGVRKMDPWPIYFGFWCLMTNTTKLD